MSFDHYGVRRSINELNSIFSCQWSNGMLPHIRFAALPSPDRPYRPDAADWGVSPAVSGEASMPTSGITQPPIVGWCVWQVFHRIDFAARLYYHDQFCEMVFALQRYHDWLFRERDPQHENLVACIHPWETGMDNSPAFAPLLERVHRYLGAAGSSLPPLDFRRADTTHVNVQHRPTGHDYGAYLGLLNLLRFHQYNCDTVLSTTPFLLQDVLFNSILCASVRALASLQEALAHDSKDGGAGEDMRKLAAGNHIRADHVAGAIRAKLWDRSTGYFYAFDLKGPGYYLHQRLPRLCPCWAESHRRNRNCVLLPTCLLLTDSARPCPFLLCCPGIPLRPCPLLVRPGLACHQLADMERPARTWFSRC